MTTCLLPCTPRGLLSSMRVLRDMLSCSLLANKQADFSFILSHTFIELRVRQRGEDAR